jgi:ribosomal protein S12 methylthiotransferase
MPGRRRRKVIVSGCLSQRYATSLPSLLPSVAAYLGLDLVPMVAAIVGTVPRGRGAAREPLVVVSDRPAFIPDYDTPHVRLTPQHSSYVKIAEGCNHACSFCVIPRIRGRHRSRSMDSIVREARGLVDGGCREICLVSQDSTYYGMDMWEGERPRPTSGVDSSRGDSLTTLLRELNAIEGDFWIRVLYTHPAHWSDELMDAFANCEKVVKYVDIPLQHAADPVLAAMSRKIDSAKQRDLVKRLRSRIPEVFLRSTFIVGFPGESEADFVTLCDFLRESGIERGGVFEYSREEDTRAYGLEGRVHHATARRRRNKATELLFDIASKRSEALIGRTLRVLVDGVGTARTQWDAPDVDGTVEVDKTLPVGQFADVLIEDAVGYQLFAKGA